MAAHMMMVNIVHVVLISLFSVGVAQDLEVTVVVPEYLLFESSTTMECTFPNDNIADVESVSWKGSNISNTDPTVGDDVVYYYDGTIYGPEMGRVQMNATTFSITIPVVEYPKDERKYWCFVSLNTGGAGNNNGIATVGFIPTVSMKYGENPVVEGDKVTIDNEGCEFSCEAVGARPESNFEWTIDAVVTEDGITETIEDNTDDSKLRDTLSTMTCAFPSTEHDLCCSASTPFDEKHRICISVIAPGGNKGLSDGKIAGTVIGCSICVLGIGGGLVYYFVIYKKDK